MILKIIKGELLNNSVDSVELNIGFTFYEFFRGLYYLLSDFRHRTIVLSSQVVVELEDVCFG